MRIVLPTPVIHVDTPTGVDPVWFEKFEQLTAFANLFSEVNFGTMTTNQVLIWDATKKKFFAGAN